MSRVGKIARRSFLVGAVAAAGGVAFGVWRYKTPYRNPLLSGLNDGEAALTGLAQLRQSHLAQVPAEVVPLRRGPVSRHGAVADPGRDGGGQVGGAHGPSLPHLPR